MLFPTLEFAIFFLVVLAGAWALHRQHRIHLMWLLAASYSFYALWEWRDALLLLGVSVMAWLFALMIYTSSQLKVRRLTLAVGCLIFLATLAYFKYSGFILTLLPAQLLVSFDPKATNFVNPALPLGISFIVFHIISLMVDVYRGKIKRSPGLKQVLLYIAFFPQLVAGPILRAAHFLPQLDQIRQANRIAITRGMLLITLGLFKKVILANYLGTTLVDPVFSGAQGEGQRLQAVYGYAVQIYCDFCGYTDIAIGCALLLGYRFPLNFRNPYSAVSIQDFWRRWHITLSSWLRDYLYIPMGGSRRGFALTLLFLMITMLIGGLWHGAGWQFVFWGAYHGLLLVLYQLWRRLPESLLLSLGRLRIWRGISIFITFHLVCVGWIWFRAPGFEHAMTILISALNEIDQGRVWAGADPWAVVAIVTGISMQFQPLRSRGRIERWIASRPWAVQGAIFAAAICLIEAFGPIGVPPFIYFQF